MASSRNRILHVTILATSVLTGTILTIVILQRLLVCLAIYIVPSLEASFYDLGLFGIYRTRKYVSFNLSSPQASIVQWDGSCDDGFIFLDSNGPSVDPRGPIIFDAKNNLVWTSDQFGATNALTVQQYSGQEYLTLWYGHKMKGLGMGSYYVEYELQHHLQL